MTREDALRASEYIKARECDNGMIAYNFTRQAFQERAWDGNTVTARGLFVRDNTVIGRGYNKFFAIDEDHGYTREQVENDFALPVHVARKMNGYLGIMFEDQGQLFLYSKSGNTNFADYARDMLHVTDSVKQDLIDILRDNNVSVTLEVRHPGDPHIVDDAPGLYLLDVIDNDYEFHVRPELRDVVLHASRGAFNDVEGFDVTARESVKQVINDGYASRHEGYVMRDAQGRMTKVKSDYYRAVKSIRYALFALAQGKGDNKLEAKAKDGNMMAQFVLDRYTQEMVDECIITSLNGGVEMDIPRFMALIEAAQ